jgi:hypothetical protein
MTNFVALNSRLSSVVYWSLFGVCIASSCAFCWATFSAVDLLCESMSVFISERFWDASACAALAFFL